MKVSKVYMHNVHCPFGSLHGLSELRRDVKLVKLDHFKLLRVVGKGAFGKVRIVERKDTNLTFALKYIRKDEGKYVLTTENRARAHNKPHSRTV